MSKNPTISVILCTYAGDDPADIKRSFDSITKQTRLPDEVVFIIDGPVPDALKAEILDCVGDAPFETIVEQLDTNQGHGGALQAGVKSANGTYIAIQDADDISVPNRFEEQIKHIEQNDADLIGGQIAEFTEDPDSPERVRRVPLNHEAIIELFPRRCPVNQTTVLASREAILKSGNYRSVDRMEDYDLWGRMLANGYIFHNLDIVLSKVKVEDMSGRRGGLEYAREEVRQQLDFLEYGVVSVPQAVRNVVVRAPFRLLPNNIRSWLYSNMFRSQ